MGLDTVVDDITDEAEAEAERIVQEAESDAEETLSEAESDAEGARERAVERAEREAEEVVEQAVSGARLDARKLESETKKELLDELRAEVEDRVAALEDGREELTEALLSAAVDELGGSGVVHHAEGDDDLVAGLVDDFDGYEVGGEVDVLGGVVVEAEDGDVRVDNSFDSVLERTWNDGLREFSSALLEEG
ncbi:MAG: V-type ATP synthase subunit E family protein [Halobacteriota archaeon]